MKKAIFFPALLAFSTILTGCGHQADPNVSPEGTPLVYTSYINKAEQFAISFPESWSFKENVYGTKVSFFSPLGTGDKEKENLGIAVNILSSGSSLESNYILIKNKLQTSMPNLSILEEKDTTIGHLPAKTIIYTVQSNDFNIKWKQTFFVSHNKLYTFTYIALKQTFDMYEAIVDKMIGSFILE